MPLRSERSVAILAQAEEQLQSTRLLSSAEAMSDSFMVRTRKFKNNPLLARKQFVVEVIHPNLANISKKDLAEKLAKMYKHDNKTIQLFGFKTAFGGGRSTGFGLMYDNQKKKKKKKSKGQ
mmetsp:Transcript_11958/g.9624  ORF Transcript_11958/g.9624 Transcript_11958/m.9624 type:complete len:121 (-) Transcript_11958:20-382(-)